MNFKRFHESKNLFDYVAYFDSTFTAYNQFFEYATIQLKPNTTYTLSTSITEQGSKPRNTAFIVATTNQTPKTASGGLSNVSPITITTESDGVLKLYKRISGTGVIPTKAVFDNGDWIMLNLGSQPLPYEPYSSEVWHDIPHYTHKTATDTLTLPATLYPNDTSITVGLKGNTVQNGTPTPDSPIMPQGTGERTGNLFDAATAYGNLYNNGVVSGTTAYVCQVTNYFTDEQIGKQITISIKADKVAATRIYIVTNVSGTSHNSNSIYENNTGILQITVTPQSTSDYWKMSYGSNANNECIISNIMLNTGSTALPYEPYGIKIPISSAGQTTPVYLGEVETTRKIKKVVLTGNDGGTWNYNPSLTGGNSFFNTSIFKNYAANKGAGYCTHYPLTTERTDTIGVLFGNNINFITDFTEGIDTADKWVSYLQQQYSAGTPVTVWYVLATPTTGIVNEPLRKIGDYADEVSGISIPTVAGTNTLSIGTALQPSEVTVNYKGWHPVTDVHEADNGAWT